jgi:hypothetical protein
LIGLRERDTHAGECGLKARVRGDRALNCLADRERVGGGIGLVERAAIEANDAELQRSR